MWDQFADPGPLEHHALVITTQSPDDSVAAVQQAITSGRSSARSVFAIEEVRRLVGGPVSELPTG